MQEINLIAERLGVSILDLFLVLALLLSGAMAFIRGLVREMVALGVWLGSSAISSVLYPSTLEIVKAHVTKNETAADALTGVALFSASLVILIPLGNFISSQIKGKTLTSIDRSLGFVFGLARGYVILCLLYLCLLWVWPDEHRHPDWLVHAKAQPILADGASMIKSIAPKSVLKNNEEEIKKDKAQIEQAQQHIEELNKVSNMIPGGKDAEPATYTDGIRGGLDQLFDKKDKQP